MHLWKLLIPLLSTCRLVTTNVLLNREGLQANLIRDLLYNYTNGYHKSSVPVGLGSDDAVEVKLGIALLQIVDFDMRGQVLKTMLWERYKWVDPHLAWNVSEHGGISQVSVPADSVWLPDVVLENVADETKNPRDDNIEKVWLSSDGTVFMTRAVIRSTRCIVNLEFFPFDHQVCYFKYFSWVYSSSVFKLQFLHGHGGKPLPADIDTSSFTITEWAIVNTSGFINVTQYPCCDDPFYELIFSIRLKRIYNFYNLLLVWPGIILSLLAAIVFWLPPGSSDKTGIGLSVFLSFFLLLIILKEVMPMGQRRIPRLAELSYKNMFAIFASVLTSTFVLNIYCKANGDRHAPWLLRVIFIDFMARIFLVKCKEQKNITKSDFYLKEVDVDIPKYFQENTSIVTSDLVEWQKKIHKAVKELVNFEETKERNIREETEINTEWYVIAKVIDRLFFIGYSCFLCITLTDWIIAIYSTNPAWI